MLADYRGLPRAVHLLCLGVLVNRAGSFVLLFLALYLDERLGFGAAVATRCLGAFGLGSLVATVIGGQLADRVGRRAVLAGSSFGGAALLVVLSFLESPLALAIGFFAFGAIVDMYRPAAGAMLGDLVSVTRRSQAFGLLYVAINLGVAVGAFAGGFLAGVSWRLLFYGDALTTATFGAIALFALPETLPRGGEDEATQGVPLAGALRRIARDVPFLLLCFAMLLCGIVFMQSMSTLPLHLRRLDFPPHAYGSLVTINGILIVLFQLPLSSFCARFDRMRVVITGGAAIAVGFFLNGQAVSYAAFAGAVVIWTLGEMLQFPTLNALVTDLAPPAIRARYIGTFTLSFSMAHVIGAPLGGEVLARLGPAALWGGAFAVAATGTLLFAAIAAPMRARSGRSSDRTGHEDVTPD